MVTDINSGMFSPNPSPLISRLSSMDGVNNPHRRDITINLNNVGRDFISPTPSQQYHQFPLRGKMSAMQIRYVYRQILLCV